MTSISNNPVMAAAVNAVAKEIVSTLAAFAAMRITPIASQGALGSLLGANPTNIQLPPGAVAYPDGRVFDPTVRADPNVMRPQVMVQLPDGRSAHPYQVRNITDYIQEQPYLPPRCGCPGWVRVPTVDPITVTQPSDGSKAEVDLGDGYTMTLNEHSSEIIVRDANGDETRIWGDPHVDVNGKRVGDFYDTTTFELKNGTKITINTEPWEAGGNGAYVASQVVVTRGDQGLVIDGISQNDKGDLRITQGYDGQALDFAHDDGFNLTEAGDGASYGWDSEFTGERVTRSEMREMTLHANREMREGLEMDRDVTQAFGAWLMFGDLGAMLSLAGSESFERDTRETLQERPVYAFLERLMGVDR